MTSVLELYVECERRIDCPLLPDVKSISDQFFAHDDLLNKVFKHRKRESFIQPGTLSQQEKDDVQPFRD